jgi:hypothetical protein
MANLLKEIVDAFGSSETSMTSRIHRSKVLEWAQSTDIETLGALYTYLMEPRYSERIHPHLNFEHYANFVLPYLERCIVENPEGEWSLSNYEAGYEYARWFRGAWIDTEVPRDHIELLTNHLATLYMNGNSSQRRCVVDAVLEHLFEDKKIVSAFSAWASDKALSVAYSEALMWAKGGA